MKRSLLFLLIACTGTIGDELPSSPIETDPIPDEGWHELANTEGSALHRLLDHQAAAVLEDTFAELEVDLPLHLLPSNATRGLFEVNDRAPDDELVDAYWRFAEAAAEAVVDAAACSDWACVRSFVRNTARGLYRREPSEDELAGLAVLETAPEGVDDYGPQDALRLQLTALLMAPQFWYRVETGDWNEGSSEDATIALEGEEIANRLALVLWRRGPDEALLDAAAAGELNSARGREEAARRMLADPRSDGFTREFFGRLFELQEFGTQERYIESSDAAASYPGLASLVNDMRAETQTFTASIMRSEGASFEELLRADYTYASAALASYYGIDIDGSEARRITLPEGRAGVLSHGAVLGAHTTTETYRAAHRGRFVLENLLCRELPPVDLEEIPVPPANVSPREKFEAMTAGSCQACHANINGIGFLFEHFDGGGRYANDWDGFRVDASGHLPGGSSLNGVAELGRDLAESDPAQRCLTLRFFEFVYGRPAAQTESALVDDALHRFRESQLNMRELLVTLVGASAFTARTLPTSD